MYSDRGNFLDDLLFISRYFSSLYYFFTGPIYLLNHHFPSSCRLELWHPFNYIYIYINSITCHLQLTLFDYHSSGLLEGLVDFQWRTRLDRHWWTIPTPMYFQRLQRLERRWWGELSLEQVIEPWDWTGVDATCRLSFDRERKFSRRERSVRRVGAAGARPARCSGPLRQRRPEREKIQGTN